MSKKIKAKVKDFLNFMISATHEYDISTKKSLRKRQRQILNICEQLKSELDVPGDVLLLIQTNIRNLQLKIGSYSDNIDKLLLMILMMVNENLSSQLVHNYTIDRLFRNLTTHTYKFIDTKNDYINNLQALISLEHQIQLFLVGESSEIKSSQVKVQILSSVISMLIKTADQRPEDVDINVVTQLKRKLIRKGREDELTNKLRTFLNAKIQCLIKLEKSVPLPEINLTLSKFEAPNCKMVEHTEEAPRTFIPSKEHPAVESTLSAQEAADVVSDLFPEISYSCNNFKI